MPAKEGTLGGPRYRPTVRSFARTHVGRHRKENEDAFFRDDELRLYMVADGMGGHAAGEMIPCLICQAMSV